MGRIPIISTSSFATAANIQNAAYTYAADAQANDAYAITLTPAPSAYAAGQIFTFKANTANTGAASLNVNSLGAKTIKKNTDQDLATGDIEAGSIVSVVYDGTNFQMVSTDSNITQDEIGDGSTNRSYTNTEKSKLAGIEALADVTDATNVDAAGALMKTGGTMSGNIVLGENTSLDLDPAGSADGKYTGICITGTAGAALAFGDLIYLAVADSRWELADADALATAGNVMIGMCVLAAAADGNATKVLLMGQIRADAKFPALTVGAAVYAGETAGAIQTSIPTGADNVIRVVGFALTADEIYFNPSQDHQLTVA